MNLFFHYSAEYFSNTYLIGPKNGGDAIIVDPCVLDVSLLEMIENNHLNIKWVLITRFKSQNAYGCHTLKKIYDVELFSRRSNVLGFHCNKVRSGTPLKLGAHTVSVIGFPEYSQDTVIYRINNWVFCGDILSAGLPGLTTNPFSKANIQQALLKKLFSGNNDLLIFPGEGPPTILHSEKLFNSIVRQSGEPAPTDLKFP